MSLPMSSCHMQGFMEGSLKDLIYFEVLIRVKDDDAQVTAKMINQFEETLPNKVEFHNYQEKR